MSVKGTVQRLVYQSLNFCHETVGYLENLKKSLISCRLSYQLAC